MTSDQLTFELTADVALGRADFFVSPSNALAAEAMRDWTGWPGARMALVGPAGAGKTHLARIWATESDAGILEAAALTGADMDRLATRPLCVEDAERALPGAERALFHLYNLMAERGLPLLLTARAAPAAWGVALADLESRLATLSVARIEPPDDALLSAILLKLFHDRQLTPPPNLIAYLLPRMDRSFAAAQRLVEALDRLALSRRARISRALAAQVLDNPPR